MYVSGVLDMVSLRHDSQEPGQSMQPHCNIGVGKVLVRGSWLAYAQLFFGAGNNLDAFGSLPILLGTTTD